ncbi:MAG: sigma-70 family RNA polymerase sigma factor [Armatimonadota bacterium]
MGIPTNYPGLTPEMVNLVKHKAYTLSNQFGFSPEDREDLEQDMALQLLSALQSYNPKKGTLSTFADRVIRHWTSELIRSRSTMKRDYTKITCSFDDLCSAEDGEYETLADIIGTDDIAPENITLGCIDGIELKADIDRVIDRLPENLRDLCISLKTQDVADYCEATGIPRSTAESRLRKLRKIFKKAGFGK